MSVLELSDQTATEVTSKDLVLVDCWASWCGPCKAFAPTFEEVATSYKDKGVFCKINVEDNPEFPTKHAIRGIPTILAFKNGQVVDRKVGALSKDGLCDWIDSLLS